MLGAFTRAFRTPDLRRKIFFTLAVIGVFRLGSFIPTPGVSYTNVQQCLKTNDTNGLVGLANLFSGGGLLQLSIFALGIMPYITASIIIQLLRVVVPRFEELHKEGQTGNAKLTQYTRYLTMALAILQSTTYIALARAGRLIDGCTNIFPNDNWHVLVLAVVTMTAGTGLVMWLGELITERGVGNGMSLLIFISIASTFPAAIWSIGQTNGIPKMLLVIAIGLIITAMIVFVEQSQRRVPVQYAKRMVGRRQYGGTSTYIPMKVNMAGVIPVIFASSLLYVPILLTQFFPDQQAGWVVWIANYIGNEKHWSHALFYFVLIIFFTYFYVAITFNPDEVADNIKQAGGFIPGYRAGKPTADYLAYLLDRLTLPGSLYLGLVALIPLIAINLVNTSINFPFGGTSILIIVGVGLETVKQIESQLQQRHYEGFLR